MRCDRSDLSRRKHIPLERNMSDFRVVIFHRARYQCEQIRSRDLSEEISRTTIERVGVDKSDFRLLSLGAINLSAAFFSSSRAGSERLLAIDQCVVVVADLSKRLV